MNRIIATVAVENTFFSYGSDYDYYVPEGMEDSVSLGSKVKIPFGNSKKLREGIVVKIYAAVNSRLKEIHSVIGSEPILSEEMISLALWMKERCFCTTYDCLKQMLPRKFGEIKEKSSKYAVLTADDEASLPKLTPKQKSVVDLLFDIGSAGVSEICEFCSVGKAVINNLEKYGIIKLFDKKIERRPYKPTDALGDMTEITLTEKQNDAYLTFKSMLDGDGGTGLLFGVTGSGKTQVYLKLIDDAVTDGKSVIVLVPEIGLTAQAVKIFLNRYGDRVAVIHSGLSLGERNDEYQRIKSGDASIVVGTRSAVFSPIKNLGLIIMDEEQESSYKSERTPRYNAKDVSNFRAKYNKALFLMISATPGIETYSNAVSGKYRLCELDERYGDAGLPKVEIIDMKGDSKPAKSSLSPKLKEYIAQALDNNKQIILLINRRGYNTFIACCDCGHVITCPNCAISLTYHSYSDKLVCHYCGYTKNLDVRCTECGSDNIRYSGFGTQRIEDEINAFFPNARTVRMDADTTGGRFSHDKIFDAFKNHNYDILIGTQMVAKGLDFPDVTLVGVVNADNFLYDENYNSSEKAFDLITQVVGRSGRRNSRGTAVIQTINPFNSTVEFAANQDYKGFYKYEIALRKALIYPPFCDIYSVTFNSENENNAALAAKSFFEQLKLHNDEMKEKIIVLGPTAAKISKINKTHRYKLSIKCKNSKNIRLLLNNTLKSFDKIKADKNVSVSIDLNPYDLN